MKQKLLVLFLLGTAFAAAQPNATLSPIPYWQPLGPNATLYPGAKVCSYVAGTTTPQATYTDSTAGTANPNPTILDANGGATIWLKQLGYKLVLLNGGDGTCSTGTVVGSWDQIWPIFQQTTSLNSLIGSIALIGTSNEITVISSGQTITLATPQAIAPTSSPTFAGVTITGAVSAAQLLLGSTTILDPLANLENVASIVSLGSISGIGYFNNGSQIVDTSSNGHFNQLTVTNGCTGCMIFSQSVVTVNRVLGVTYQNTGPRPMFVNIQIGSATGGFSIAAVSDSSSTPITPVCVQQSYPTDGMLLYSTTLSFWVMPGNYYATHTYTGTPLLQSWIEWK